MPNFDEVKSTTQATNNTATEQPTRRNRDVDEARDDLTTSNVSLIRAAGRRMTTAKSNQYLDQVDKGIREELENYPDVKNIMEVVKISDASLRYPCVAMVQRAVIDGKTHAAYFMFPVQDRSTVLERKNNDRNSRRDVPAVPTDVIDSKYYNAVEDGIATTLSLKNDTVYVFAGVNILGELFKLDHKENSEGYMKLIEASVGHTDAVLEEKRNTKKSIIRSSMMNAGTTLVGRIDYSPSVNTDLAGNPIRSDLNLTISQQTNNRKRDSRDESFNGDAGMNQALISIDAVTNFIYTDQDSGNRSRRDNPQKFLPEIRITNLENRFVPSLGNTMFCLANIAAVTQDSRWVKAHAPSLVRNLPGRNLGGLYAEQPEKDQPEEPTDLSEASIDEVYDFADYACQPNVLVTLMASESSENSRLFDRFFVLAEAEVGSPEYNEVYDQLMDELEVMLGEPLDWSPRDPIFASDQLHRNLVGYYQSENEVNSTEDIDYLSIVNSGTGLKPLETAADWDNSYGIHDYQEGTATRARIIQQETDGMVKFTGAQTTLTISMPFLNALNRALAAAGLGIVVEDRSDSPERRVRRPLSGFSNFAGRAEGFGRRRNDRRDERGRGHSRSGSRR